MDVSAGLPHTSDPGQRLSKGSPQLGILVLTPIEGTFPRPPTGANTGRLMQEDGRFEASLSSKVGLWLKAQSEVLPLKPSAIQPSWWT